MSEIKIGEVSLCTNDVICLADFYKALLGVESNSSDAVHQTILLKETALTIYNDGSVKNNQNQNICLAFTVKDVDAEFARLVKMGVNIIEEPQTRPWGMRNLHFCDPDGNHIYFRSPVNSRD